MTEHSCDGFALTFCGVANGRRLNDQFSLSLAHVICFRCPQQRAPEECRAQKKVKRTKRGKIKRPVVGFSEKVETYRLGVFFFFLLSNAYPFRFEPEGVQRPNRVKKWVISGRIPELPTHVKESEDLAIQALIQVMRRAMTVDIRKRPRTREIADMLVKAVEELELHGSSSDSLYYK